MTAANGAPGVVEQRCKHCGAAQQVYFLCISWPCDKCGLRNPETPELFLSPTAHRLQAAYDLELMKAKWDKHKPYKRFGKRGAL